MYYAHAPAFVGDSYYEPRAYNYHDPYDEWSAVVAASQSPWKPVRTRPRWASAGHPQWSDRGVRLRGSTRAPLPPRDGHYYPTQDEQDRKQETHLWTQDQVQEWLHAEGLADCAMSFKSAKIDGRALLMLQSSDMKKELALNDEETQLRVCAALSPLKRRSHIPSWSIKDTFTNYDKDGSGELDSQELRHAMRHYGLDLSGSKVRQALKRYDDNPDGKLDLAEFEKLIQDIDAGAVKSAAPAPAPAAAPKPAPAPAPAAAPKPASDSVAEDNQRLQTEVAMMRGQLAKAHTMIARLQQQQEAVYMQGAVDQHYYRDDYDGWY